MKQLCKVTAFFLAVIMLLGVMPIMPISFSSAAEAAKDEVLFSSSFENTDPAIFESQSDNGYYKGLERYETVSMIPGDFTELVDLSSVRGSNDFKSEESKVKLFDSSKATKFLTETKPSASSPVWVSFALVEAQVVGVYAITTGNDEPGRDPKSWKLYGSTDGVSYTLLDTRTGEIFGTPRGVTRTYEVTGAEAYRYYKIEITENNGSSNMTQFADLYLGTGEEESTASIGDSPLQTVTSKGPVSSWVASGAFEGRRALSVFAKQTDKGESYARNLLYSGLNIKVADTTKLHYVHYLATDAGYDYEYNAAYMMIDLEFTDGTYLSSLGAYDQNGFGMTPIAKGEADSLYSDQWNYVETALADVAKGKTIDSVYVYYHKNKNEVAKKFHAFFDSLVIENKADPVYEHLSDYINTLRGTNNTTSFSRGLTTPFINMPNGFNMVTPVTNSGSNTHYSYFEKDIVHFSVTHVASTWTGDYGTWQFMANSSLDSSDLSKVNSNSLLPENLGASFSHDNEVAKAHYYSVTFDEGSRADGVKVEMTPTLHGVYVRFTFPEDADNVNIIFDCVRAGGSVAFSADGGFTARSEHTARGSGNLYIAGEFSTLPSAYKANGKQGIAVFPKGTKEVTMKFATSFISPQQASHNMELELGAGESFDSIFQKAQKAWDDICGIVEVEGASYTQLVTLYSNLYRMYSYPTLYSENKGTNENPEWVYASPYKSGRVTDGKLYVNNGFWDTYRTAWAAYALLTPKFDGELLDGILQHYRDNSWIPRWVAPGGTDSMLGTSSDIIFADAYIKGIDFDYETAFESMLKNAATVSPNVTNGGRAENHTAIFTGYVPNDKNVQYAFSWTMEDYISDYCIAAMAAKLGYDELASYFYNRAAYYVNLYNPTLKFFMGKNSTGGWSSGSGYNPYGWWGDYTETNGWTMLFAPVYDGNGLANLLGGKAMLLQRLNSYFDDSYAASVKIEGGTIHEMAEAREVRMGIYSHSNQPAHAIPYLFPYANAPYRTQEIVREVMQRLYVGSEIGQGYLGDEDNGEMSAWYVLSAMGLYPQNMARGEYVIGSPLFSKMTVHMDNGKDLTIIANNNSDQNIYVQSLTVNGKAHNDAFISHDVIASGATLVFEMGDKPSDWGKGTSPTSLTSGGKKADPAEDIVTSRYKMREDAFGEDFTTNTVYLNGIADGKKLFDNNSNTYTTVKNGTSVVVTSSSLSRLWMYTVTSNNKNRAPQGLKLEASLDGKTWVTLDERENLKFEWTKYTYAFEIPDEKFGNYQHYRLTFLGNDTMQVAEVEFLTLPKDGEAGALSAKPQTPADSSAPTKPQPPTTPESTSKPQTPITPETTDTTETPQAPDTTGGDVENGGDSSLGIIIGIGVAALVALGGGVMFMIFSKKKR